MPNLVTSYESLYPSKKAAREALNAELGLNTTASLMGEWRNGKHHIPDRVQEFMREKVICNYSKGRVGYYKVLELIQLPRRKK